MVNLIEYQPGKYKWCDKKYLIIISRAKLQNKCLNVREQVEVVKWNKISSPLIPCCAVSRQCPWKKIIIEKKNCVSHKRNLWYATCNYWTIFFFWVFKTIRYNIHWRYFILSSPNTKCLSTMIRHDVFFIDYCIKKLINEIPSLRRRTLNNFKFNYLFTNN